MKRGPSHVRLEATKDIDFEGLGQGDLVRKGYVREYRGISRVRTPKP